MVDEQGPWDELYKKAALAVCLNTSRDMELTTVQTTQLYPQASCSWKGHFCPVPWVQLLGLPDIHSLS